MAAAVAVVVAAGAAIATGIAVNQSETTPLATQSIYTEQLELLKAETFAQPGVQAAPDRAEMTQDLVNRGLVPAATLEPTLNRADQVHRGRAPAIGTQQPTGAQVTEDLVNRGLVPAAALEPAESPLFDSPENWYSEVIGASETTPFVEQPGGPK